MDWENKKTEEPELEYPEWTTGNPERERTGKGSVFQKRWVKALSIVMACAVALAITGVLLFNSIFGGIRQSKLDQADLGISTEELAENVPVEKLNKITNIALFGIDTTEGAATIGDQYRSDCIIVFSIDPIDNKLKMTSILRDSKVPIEGHDPQKINAAYKYGGAQLAVKTLNQNFKTNIKDYITVDFSHMAEIIDLVGGLTIEITEAEAKNMMQNNIIKPVKEGKHLLDGAQCVAYARVRKVDSDYYRAGRQQKVLTLLFDKLKSVKKTEYPSLIKSFMKCVETSLSYGDILKFANSIEIRNAEVIKNTIPDAKYEAGLWGGVDNTGSWVWVYDLDAAAARLRKIIYGGFDPEEAVAPGTGGGTSGGNVGSSSGTGTAVPQQTTAAYTPPADETTAYQETPTIPQPTEEAVPSEESVTEEPITETQETQPPTTVEPKTEAPETREPETQPPTTAEPETEMPTEPETQPPTTAEPKTETPTEPEMQPPTAAEPKTETPTEPETEAPAIEEPAEEDAVTLSHVEADPAQDDR